MSVPPAGMRWAPAGEPLYLLSHQPMAGGPLETLVWKAADDAGSGAGSSAGSSENSGAGSSAGSGDAGNTDLAARVRVARERALSTAWATAQANTRADIRAATGRTSLPSPFPLAKPAKPHLPAAPTSAGDSISPEGPPSGWQWEQVSWLAAERLGPAERSLTLAALRQLPGEPVVSIEAEAAAAPELMHWLAEEPATEGPPVWLRWVLNGFPQAAALEEKLAEEHGGEEELRRALRMLAERGLPLVAELRLVRGALAGEGGPATVEPLREACRWLTRHRVRPQALLVCEWLPPALRLEVSAALALAGQLRGWISGVAAPQVVHETGSGKRTACVPERIESTADASQTNNSGADNSRAGRRVTVRNYRDQLYSYLDPPAGPSARE